jgi:RNase adaptor protein for sRNA GlmZ degradation
MTVQITSFGYGHPEGAPEAHLTLDLRRHFRDPHVSPEMRYLTAYDELVRQTVMETSGIRRLVLATVAAIHAYEAGPSAVDTTVAVGCAGGRHRAATVGMALAVVLSGDVETAQEFGLADVAAEHEDQPLDVVLVHRDLFKDVIAR